MNSASDAAISQVRPTSGPPPSVSWRSRYGWFLQSGLSVVAANVVHHFGLVAPGNSIWLLNGVLVFCVVASHPRVVRWLCGGQEPTALRIERGLAEQAARDSEERFRALVQDSSDVVTVTDAAGQVEYVSGAVQHVMGYSPEEYLRRAGRDMVHADDMPTTLAMAEALNRGASAYRTEVRILHADGTWHWHEVHARNLLDHPAVRGIVYNHRDITERKEYQQRLAYEASHDSLTGLVNRAELWQALDKVCSDSGNEPAAVLYLDLDDFKRVNDELGHAAGDELLRATAHRVRGCVLGEDVVARLGGDEFAVLLHHIAAPEDAIRVAERIIERLAEPVSLDGQLIHARASIGVAMCTPGTINAAEALHRADVAMYRAKRDETSGWQLHLDNTEQYQAHSPEQRVRAHAGRPG